MAWSESKAWLKGTTNQNLYQALLDDATAAPAREAAPERRRFPPSEPGRG